MRATSHMCAFVLCQLPCHAGNAKCKQVIKQRHAGPYNKIVTSFDSVAFLVS